MHCTHNNVSSATRKKSIPVDDIAADLVDLHYKKNTDEVDAGAAYLLHQMNKKYFTLRVTVDNKDAFAA